MAQAEAPDREVRLAFRIGYLGGGFYGSQYQPDARTVEGEIRNACLRAGLFSDPGSARLGLSGRTDRGVHARCQIIAFSTRYPDRAVRALPGQLPPDIWVNDVCEVPDWYSPRHDVISRTYRYIFDLPLSDISLMQEAGSLFIGKHDFSCFSRVEHGKNPIRNVSSLTICARNGCCWFEITAQSFLWHMVRGVATALLQASESQITAEEITALLSGWCTNKVRPATPDGLILWSIHDHLDWNALSPLKRTVRLHDQAAAHHRLMAIVHTLLKP